MQGRKTDMLAVGLLTSPSPGAQVAHGHSHLAYTYLYAVTATKYEIKLVANE